ncbi:achaete-scute homolog 1a-like [Anthonomus grandis grandis]|uniref:achaete-scute homolog 1a-like n=1 Tax=Anthonomus grandis grandis TaxID=2921223 RepID=UPI002166A797|nr:achaete-scute homolog 1a-like [Anthonomus grandis grandis]
MIPSSSVFVKVSTGKGCGVCKKNAKMYHSTTFDSDGFFLDSASDSQDFWAELESTSSEQDSKKPLREKNNSGRRSGYKHIPHNERPRQSVERRNARERRRVQAVNNAFVKLRSVVPIQNSRGKRISKVKTLLFAIDYIRALDEVLQKFDNLSPDFHIVRHYCK